MTRQSGRHAGRWTSEAGKALERAGLSRRDFLKGSGALIVTFSASGGVAGAAFQPGPTSAARDRVDSWIAVTQDGRVTAYTGKSELGQGLFTAQAQLIAEELVVAIERVTLVQCDTAMTPDQGTTSGSQSHPDNFNHANLAQAAATAREALFALASARLGVPVKELTAKNGVISTVTDPIREVGYAELVGGRKFDIPVDAQAKRRAPADWTVLGTSVPRLEIPAMVTGQFEFVHNIAVPGMLHGQVIRPPVVGARLQDVDESSVRGMPGLVKVVVKKDFVGVVADGPWQAIQAARRLKTSWTPGVGLPDRTRFAEYLRGQPSRDTLVVDSKNVDAVIGRARHEVKATYYYPYQVHGSMGTSCAVADVRGHEATIWSATQATHPLRQTVATILGIPSEGVRVIFRLGSGCYGVNGADTVSYDAALLSQAVGKPVRVQLLRKDEMAWENFGVAYLIDQRVGLDENGNILAWDYEAWTPELGGRPGYRNPGNVVTGSLVGFEPEAFTPASPASEPARFRNRSNAAPPYVAGCVGGKCGGTGTIKSERILTHTVRSPFWTGSLRSPARLQNTFAHECFMDELAARIKADPIVYRLRHLADPRLREVLTAAAKAAGWQDRPSPRAGREATGSASGRGVACVRYEGENGYSAMVAEVEVNQDSGAIAIKRMVVSIDCGPISNPDGLKNQIEGGALQGASRALLEEATWDNLKVTSIDWRTLRTWSLASGAPIVETVLINRPEAEANGAGETSITVAAAAIANAIFDATGARLREAPFTQERVKAALVARQGA